MNLGTICRVVALVICVLVLFGVEVGGLGGLRFLALGCGIGFAGTLI